MEETLLEERERNEIRVEENNGKVIVEREIGGRTLRIETGELAKQASGSALVRYGDTVVLASATISRNPREGIDFFPLVVDFEEKMYAAGKMPGGFFKREGRPSEKSILSSRLIDRPIRPLFPEGMRHEVQVICTVLSADMENDADLVGMVGASAALTISGIPFHGPIAGIRIGRMDDEFIVNPTLQQLIDSNMNLTVAGTKDNIMMVECKSEEASEDMLLEALALAHKEIGKVTALIEVLKEKAGKPPIEIPLKQPNAELEEVVRANFSKQIAQAMRIIEKQERLAAFAEISRSAALEILEKSEHESKDRLIEILNDAKSSDFEKIIKKIQEEELRIMVVEENLRPDGRKTNEIRPITCRVGILPRTHGTGLFTRGQTQVLTSLTLAPMSEGQEIDDLTLEEVKRYMHQYNFPPYSVGETRPVRGPGRREIGHGSLAEKALLPMIPDEDEFPYSIRAVSEVLESNGSSSMASVCASTLALMDAGVPIHKPVAGIAMGLILKDGKYTILTDIQGLEDDLGEMDFKVAGTRDGVNALQMDIKVEGISISIMKEALAQAQEARFKILDLIHDTIPEPRTELSPYAPRIFTMIINPDKIREVIGPGGKIINRIIDETGCTIDIENDGTIYIATNNLEMAEKAQAIIKGLVSEPEVGEVYQGKVTRLADFGAFVEIKPGKDGLIRLSDMPGGRNVRVQDILNFGDELTVEITEIDSMGRINLKSAELQAKVREISQSMPPRREGEGGGRPPFRPRGGSGGGRRH